MNSFSILRTNVGLTTNVKVIISSTYGLYMDSIDSNSYLSSTKYKKVQFNKNSYYDEIVPNFFSELPVDIAFNVKYSGDNDNMFNTFDHQFDDIYQMGCRNIIDNKNYTEEFECFAPIYIGSDSFPKNFIIFRIDGPGLINLNKDNFISEIIDNLKCVSVFDLTRNTPLGEWIETNFTKNQYFPPSPFYMDFRNLEFSSWNGIDYEVGGYTSKSFFLDTVLEYENTFMDFENLIYDGYKNNKVIFPNIINLSFLFDDTPATPTSLRKWSMNRYMGFYIDDMENIKTVSPYTLPQLKSDISVISGNILYSVSGNPFVEDWDRIKSPYVEIGGVFYKIERYSSYSSQSAKLKLSKNAYVDEKSQVESFSYKIIGDIDLSGFTYSSINNNLIQINSDNSIELTNSDVLIPNYDLAHIWLININNKYHVIKKIDDTFFIQSDYAFNMTVDKLEYWINSPDPNYKSTIDLMITDNFISFKIFRCNLTDIKDLDTSIIDTDYSKFEYEKVSELTYTDESKLYTTDYSSKNNPKDYNDYIIDDKVVNIPCSSEYTANGETFRISDDDLSPIWRKNPIRVKWAYQNSISSNDYPYLLNNSFISEEFNRTVNPFNPIPNRKDRNLDYFYTVNSSTASYAYHSLHVERSIGSSIDNDFNFELDKYLNIDYDYFSYFFGKKSTFVDGSDVFNTQKWSLFEKGDNIIPNTTLFRGLKFTLQDVDDIKTSEGNIDTINLKSLNTYQGYKFSILLSKNNYDDGLPGKVIPSASDPSIGGLTSSLNNLSWYVIDNWSHDKLYPIDTTVVYYDILYRSATQSNITDPNKNPSTENTIWYPINSIFWTPSYVYSPNDIVYNSGEYYYYDPIGTTYSFWKPFDSYSYNDIVLYQNKSWISTTQSNTAQPNGSSVWRSIDTSGNLGSSNYYWVEVSDRTDWSISEIWSPIYIYTQSSITKSTVVITTPGLPYTVYNDVLYQLSPNTTYSSGDVPGISSAWIRKYSIVPDTDYVYGSTNNSIILLNNKYYKCLSNGSGSTLENGICVYINKKYKNVLINIFINDNTLLNLSNCDRDSLYSDIYSNLAALNFVNSINNISNKFGFSDYLQYVVINEDGTLNTYNFNNITSLPCLLIYQGPDKLHSRNHSLITTPVSLELSQFKPKRILENGAIITIDMMNYYNGNSLSTNINKRKDDPAIISNYSGLTNNIYNTLYRYSGYYSPLFHNIPLFESPGITSSDVGNYKFDTTLSDFGIMKERVISKINVKDNILKLRSNPDIRSIYPMLDEFGYTFTDYFIFKSTWDLEYYIECINIENVSESSNKILKS